MMIDTHLHLSKKDYDSIERVVLDAKNNNVQKLIVSACEKEDMLEALSYMDDFQDVYYTFGFHPSEALKVTDEDLDWLEQTIVTHKQIVGVGEIGLDFHYGREDEEEQKRLFHEQLALAVRLHLPVVIHSRDATQETIQIIDQYDVKGVIHCFSGSKETAKIYLKKNFYFGIGGVLTFSNSHLKEVVEDLPLEHIVLETDSPYLAPVPLRGSKNEPKNIPYIAQKLAEVKHLDVSVVEETTTENAMHLFDLEQ